MFNPDYENVPIFDRRKEEWEKDKILETITQLFKKIELIEGWKLESCVWNVSKRKTTKSEELKKHLLNHIRAIIRNPNNKELVYDIQIPILIQDQFFYMGGFLKVPVFQIYDFPIIFRRKLLKFRNNLISVSLNLGRSDDGYRLEIFNESVPIENVITACMTAEELMEFVDSKFESLDDLQEKCPPLSMIVHTCLAKWENNTEQEILHDLGKPFSKQNTDISKKARNIIFSLKAAYEIDFFSQPFMKTNSILFELFQALIDGPKSDTDLKRKRIRFSEYIYAPLTKKLYDMILTLNGTRTNKDKFQIPQTIIVDNCNVSDIVQYNFRVNPVGEIAGMLQTTLTGPGGFMKKNVPSNLRDLDPSQKGRICPADTPDRDGCGVILNMVPTVDINKDGSFGKPDEKIITSYPISLVPFLKNDDQVRLQMASNQLKQAILLDKSEKPYIKSGNESNFLEYSTYLYKAKNDGEVLHLDNKFMIVVYGDKDAELIKIGPRSTYLNTVNLLIPKFKEGEKFKKNDIICHSKMIEDGELSLGQNLLAGICIWKGFNYEDGIVLSDEVTKDKFTSIHSTDLTISIESGQVLLSLKNDEYKPLPLIGEKIKKGQVIAKIKTLDGEDGFESINIDPYEMISPVDCVISDIEIYPNSWNKKVIEFNNFIQELSIRQTDKFVILKEKLRTYLPDEEVEKFIVLNGISSLDCGTNTGKYSYKKQKIGGVVIKIQATYKEQIGIGDKIANRHGNKGVISKIIPKDQMPTLEDGRKLDIVLNPLGIISRMNVGQLYEVHLNEARYQVEQKMNLMKTEEEKLEFLEGFLDLVDKTPNKRVKPKVVEEYKKTGKIYLIQPPFESITPEDLFDIMEYSGAKFKYPVFDPAIGTNLKKEITCGYIYFLKLVHRSSDKISARSIGPYSKKTLQPLGGKSRGGAHKFGEMETWALMAHGAEKLLEDFTTVQSDSPGLKNKLLAEILGNPDLVHDDNYDIKPQSLRLMDSYLKVLGLNILKEGEVENDGE